VPTNLPVDNYGYMLLVAYQQQETKSRNTPVLQVVNLLMPSYQQWETRIKPLIYVEEPSVSGTSVSGGLIWVKMVLNLLKYAFTGKSYVFDGSNFTEAAFPVRTVYPTAVSLGDYIAVAGGLSEDGSALGSILSFGDTVYVYMSTGNYQCYVIGEGDVYVIDENNSVRAVVQTGSTPLLNGWKLVSRKPFQAVLMRLA